MNFYYYLVKYLGILTLFILSHALIINKAIFMTPSKTQEVETDQKQTSNQKYFDYIISILSLGYQNKMHFSYVLYCYDLLVIFKIPKLDSTSEGCTRIARFVTRTHELRTQILVQQFTIRNYMGVP